MSKSITIPRSDNIYSMFECVGAARYIECYTNENSKKSAWHFHSLRSIKQAFAKNRNACFFVLIEATFVSAAPFLRHNWLLSYKELDVRAAKVISRGTML